MLECDTLTEFNKLIRDHESIISKNMSLSKAKDKYFEDFWGEVKSLGAWGGDFVLVTSDRDDSETRKYFMDKGYNTIFSF